ncbi:MAG: UDP-N-acetylglucosamine 2-epimerase (non-hydrolyzing) [Kiloniellales bacterium]|nr:UDP-N-acetylglucosamine 2-epimerase (non-hydrolyzing) [Kiloniellales bacterium]
MTGRGDGVSTILCVAGARPNFVKIAPILRQMSEHPALRGFLVHTGQHYDTAMSDGFFADLRIPAPDVSLGVGSASHAVQTAEIMRGFEPVVDEVAPAAVLVVGDVNSTVAAALVAAKKHVPVVHVEAGLRSFDRAMPEEINRLVTDQLSDLLFTTEPSGRENLLREGVEDSRICFVGNVMIDTLVEALPRAVPADETLGGLAVNGTALEAAKGFGLVTLHRPSNVDEPARLSRYLSVLAEISQDLPLVFPVHPRTRARAEAAGFDPAKSAGRLLFTEPMSYLAFLGLTRDARLVITDSGGLQEETTFLGVPCITARDNTERPVTIDQGTNVLIGADPDKLLAEARRVLAGGRGEARVPALWDGKAARRIIEELARRYA